MTNTLTKNVIAIYCYHYYLIVVVTIIIFIIIDDDAKNAKD